MSKSIHLGVGIVLFCSAAIAAAVWLTGGNAADYKLALSIPTGEGPGEIGVSGGETDVDPFCPLGIAALDGDKIGVVDVVNEKIHVIDTVKKQIDQAITFRVQTDEILQGLLYEDGDYIAWTQDAAGARQSLDFLIALEDDALGTRAVSDGAGFQEAVEPPSDVITRRMERLGYAGDADGAGFFSGEKLRFSLDRDAEKTWKEKFILGGGRSGQASFSLENQNLLKIRIEFEGDALSEIERRIAGRFVAAHVLETPNNSLLHVGIVELDEASKALRFQESVLVIGPSGSVQGTYILPSEQIEFCNAKQNFAVTESGDGYAIAVYKDHAKILKLKLWPTGQLTAAQRFIYRLASNGAATLKHKTDIKHDRAKIELTALENAPTENDAEDETQQGVIEDEPSVDVAEDSNSYEETESDDAYISYAEEDGAGFLPVMQDTSLVEVDYGEKISRINVIRNACKYLKYKWVLGDLNYEPKADAICYYFTPDDCGRDGGGRCDVWMRPSRLKGFNGQRVRGLPYAWGAADRLEEFQRKISMGRPAGDVCTPSKGGAIIFDGRSAINSVFTAGVDCSGFVLRSWGWRGGRYTTSSLYKISTRIDMDELKPGDVLNKMGSHVRMFLSWKGDDQIEVIESTTSAACGGVCRRVLPISRFNGYEPLRPLHVVEVSADETKPITYEDVEDICWNED